MYMKRVTRDIDPGNARDLLKRVPRACLCCACDHSPQAQPVEVVWHDDHFLVGIPQHVDCQPGPGQEVVLLIDEGVYFFDLRAVYIRGQVKPAETCGEMPTSHTWLEVVPLKMVAWDYGTLREVRDETR